MLEIAQEDPSPANKEKFSQFLVWAQRQGLISRLQAQNLYNRYFNVKFVSLSGDYNNCDSSCRDPAGLMVQMEGELLDKELGLLKISRDQAGYQTYIEAETNRLDMLAEKFNVQAKKK